MKQAAFVVVLAGLAVTAPRLMLAFLKGDGLALTAQAEFYIFSITGIASGVVLTGGNAFIAHVLAARYRSRGFLWWLVALGWLAFLAYAIVLAAPVLVQGLQQSDLAEVLSTPRAQWGWAVTAVLSIEALVAISMAAHVLADEPGATASARRKADESVAGAARRRLIRLLEPEPALLATAEQGGMATAGQDGKATAKPDGRATAKPNGRARAKPAELKPCPNYHWGCTYVGTTYGLNAHKRFCEYERNGQGVEVLA